MVAHRLPIDADLTERTLDEAAFKLGSPIPDLTVWVGRSNRYDAQRLQANYGFALVVIPTEILGAPDAWAAQSGADLVWTVGA